MNIIQIKEENISNAVEVMTLSFADDPIFSYIFKTPENYRKKAPWMFSTWVRWSMMYGNAWMSDDGKGIVLMREPGKSQMSFVSFIRAGMLLTPWKIGFGSFIRFYFRMVTLLERKNKEIMGNTPHWYGWMICAHPDHPGLGRELMKYCAAFADTLNLPTYLETAVDRDVTFYRRYGFELKEIVDSPDGDSSLYFMMRPPRIKKQQMTSLPKYELSDLITAF